MRPSALLRRLWRAQLRLRVMAGVVIVMLVAIAAFDIGAVATMRRYLLGQRFYRAADTRAPRSARPPGSAHGGAGLPPRPACNPDLPRPPGEPGVRRRRRFRGSVMDAAAGGAAASVIQLPW